MRSIQNHQKGPCNSSPAGFQTLISCQPARFPLYIELAGASFTGCLFDDNDALDPNLGGGALYITESDVTVYSLGLHAERTYEADTVCIVTFHDLNDELEELRQRAADVAARGVRDFGRHNDSWISLSNSSGYWIRIPLWQGALVCLVRMGKSSLPPKP